MFQSWCDARGEDSGIVAMEPATLENKLRHFTLETRRQDGAPYPARSLYGIIAGIQCFLRECGRQETAFLNSSDPTFSRLGQVLDARMKELTSEGVGMIAKQAQVICKEEDELHVLWSTGVFNINSAQWLTYLVFFYNCKLFGLRGGDETESFIVNNLLYTMMLQEDTFI